jgi:formylglycine-generating enzyme required for sulfatase activity
VANIGGLGVAGTGLLGGMGGAAPEPCPERGSPMIRVPVEAGGFCIDVHEASRAEYAEFLADGPVAPEDASYCAWNMDDYEPTEGLDDPDDIPVVGVDYCDARAYCKWAGKRLCGKIGGAATEFEQFANAMESQWHAACSRGGTRVFPYGNNYDGTLCNGADYSADQNAKVPAETPICEGGYEGIFNMTGNVWEWEDACNDTTGELDTCYLRGGEFSNPEGFLRCDYGGFFAPRSFRTNSIGIRCCGP